MTTASTAKATTITATPASKRAIAIDDLAAIKLIDDPQLSPDGRRVAYVVTTLDTEGDTYRSRIWIVPADGGPPVRYTGGRNDSAPRWSPDGAWLAFLARRDTDSHEKGQDKADKGDKAQLWLLDTRGGEARQLTAMKNGVSNPVWSPDGARIAFLSRTGGRDDTEDENGDGPVDAEQGEQGGQAKRSDVKVITTIHYKDDGIHHLLVDHGYEHLFVIEVANVAAADDAAGPRAEQARQLTDGEWDDATPAWSPDGQTLAFTSNRTPDRDLNDTIDLWTVPASGGQPRKLTTTEGPSSAPAFSPDGATIAFFGHTNPEPYRHYAHTNLWTVPADGSATPRNLTFDCDRSCSAGVISDLRAGGPTQYPLWTPDGRHVYVPVNEPGRTAIARVEVASGAIAPLVAGQRAILNFSLSADGQRLAFTATDALNPGDLFSSDAGGADERQLTHVNGDLLQRLKLSVPEHLPYAGVDGWPIDGWLMKPAGFTEGERYPLIVSIHGGPASQYGWAFFHEFQLMAALGYGVLYTNPRGSTGKTAAFTVANRSRWGEEDYGDIMAGVDAALTRDWIDPERLGVGGGSFGGFMTNWVVGHTDRFKAAVTMRCVSNLLSFFGTSDIGFTFIDTQFETEPWDDVQKLLKYSPISYVKQMTTPLLIMHAEEDYRCPIEQAEQLFISLKKLGRTTEFVRFPDEDHNLSRNGKPSHRTERLRQIARWFDRYLRDGAPASGGDDRARPQRPTRDP